MSSPGPFSYKPPSKPTASKTMNVTITRDGEESVELLKKSRFSMCLENKPSYLDSENGSLGRQAQNSHRLEPRMQRLS